MPWVRTDDDCEIYYEARGEGRVLSFVGGFLGITDMWRHQLPYFSREFKCVAIDNRGMGRSDKPFPRVSYGIKRHAEDLYTVLKALGVDKTVVIGHSFGGNTATMYYLLHPEMVAGLVLAASFAAGEQLKQTGLTFEVVANAISTKQGGVDLQIKAGLTEDVAMEFAKWPLYANLGNAVAFLEFDVRERLHEIRVPTLIIHGDKDPYCPLDPCATSLKEGIPNSTLEILKGVRHEPEWEQPEKFNQLVMKFLKEKVKW